MANKLEILVVEDRKESRKAAQEYFNTRNDINITYADNFKDIGELKNFDGVISDLMFPYDSEGSLEYHENLIQKISETIRKRSEELALDSRMERILDRDLKVLENSRNGTIRLGSSAECRQYFNKIEEEMDKELEGIPVGPKRTAIVEKYSKMREELAEKRISAEQPMGVLVAELCKQKGIPYVIVTSGHGAHGDVTTPVAMYMMLEGLIKNYRGQNHQEIGMLQRDFSGQIPSKEEYVRTQIKEFKDLDPHELESGYSFDNKFITDADKTKKEIWEHALKIIRAQREKII